MSEGMQKKSVSIIIPIYNVSTFVTDCVQSVMAQTYTGPLECVIVDDCSTDDSVRKVKNLVESYQGAIDFRILNLPENKGVSVARNTGIREARHEFLYFLDGDDQIVPDCIAKMVERLEQYPDCQCVYAGFKSTESRFRWMDYTRKQIRSYSNDPDWIRRAILSRTLLTTSPCNRLISRQLIIDKSCYFYPGIRYEDELWNFELSKHLQSIAVILENTYIYISHDNSFVHTVSEHERWDRISTLCSVMLEKRSDSSDELKDEICSIWSIINDQIKSITVPPDCLPGIRKTLLKIARKAPLREAMQLLAYTSMLYLPSAKYRRILATKFYRQWEKMPLV